MKYPFSKAEYTILSTLRDSSEIGYKTEPVSLGDFHNNLPNAATFTRAQIAHAVGVLSVEGLILTDKSTRGVIDITRSGLEALRAAGDLQLD